MNYITISPALPLIAVLLYFEKKGSTRGLLCIKPFLSLLFLITALVQSHHNLIYCRFIISGLTLCLIGDVCLIFFFNKKIFTAGLAAFLTGHIMYTIAFFKSGETGIVVLAAGTVFLLVSTVIFMHLKPLPGSMSVPVSAYIIIITAMAVSAVSLRNNGAQNMAGRNLVFAGAILFYISDIFVARHRFVQKEFLNRAIGLPLYYTSQFMIALSTGLIL